MMLLRQRLCAAALVAASVATWAPHAGAAAVKLAADDAAPLMPLLDEPPRAPSDGAVPLLEGFFKEEPPKLQSDGAELKSDGAALLQEPRPKSQGALLLQEGLPKPKGDGASPLREAEGPETQAARRHRRPAWASLLEAAPRVPRDVHSLWAAPRLRAPAVLAGAAPRRRQGYPAWAPLLQDPVMQPAGRRGRPAWASLLEDRAVQAAVAPLAENAPLLPPTIARPEEKEPGIAFRDPEVWGPPTWFFLHSMTLSLPAQVPPEKQQSLKALMMDLQTTLPCPSCGEHLAEHMKEYPIEPHLATRDSMVDWMINLHNMVNRACGKRELPKEEVLPLYAAAFSEGSKRKSLEVLASNSRADHACLPSGLALSLALTLGAWQWA